ncbi:MAG: ABC transporter substrate-binding protein [Acetobacteraceae bacterium]|nr:ABC transporter substrate-binding protein [Acetobacteraceae bacterium]
MRLSAGLAVCGILTSLAFPAAAQTLRVGVSSAVTSIDPHYHNLAPNNSFGSQIYERLVELDENAHLSPGLAESWRLVAPDTWEFKLRDAKFHNGNAFSADDVVFTLNRVPNVANSPSSFAAYTRPVKATEIVDPHTIRMKTGGVFPLLPVYMAQVFVLNRASAEGMATEDFNSGKAAIGTGPFRFVSYKPGDRIEIDRYDGYWGAKAPWQHVDYRMIPNDASRVAALLAGDVDFIDFVPTEDIRKLQNDPKVKLWQRLGLRIIFLGLDQSRDGPSPFVFGPNGEKLDKNPLKDRHVRQALSVAINRQAIVERIMEDAAEPSGQFLPPGTFGYVPPLKPPPFDPAQAKKLLAEAGFPNGLRIALHGPNDRYVNDAKIIQAVGQMWQRVGVQTEVDPLPWTSYVGQANKQAFSAFLFGWGTGTAEASDPLIAQVATYDPSNGWGASNRGRYSNPEVDRLIAEALNTADDPKRDKLLQQATTIAMEDVAIIPLHIQKNVWATRAAFTYVPTVGEDLRLINVRPAK